ncbi:HK97 family phage prohead protease [Brucella anthropi]|uniref:Peptidase U35 phage prohead HK97 n=1 Tax=Brucella anthropi (strain ATCC 49188 / DSM 6882 / CCUG 24695 / JCM 21032 / LMG 3331 / NBRC 15819 / NCTC 12168 / Alc 37) TaxID=439375 RepID=A6WZ17_BRUA4|nr:prohead protease/major capsid protein fusion protein [Brucella anthropi]ABS14221.1 peptidase U35 phage prohead HK97 [Brucella anthropi ATCC 49188]QQC25746.1 HK97 family phage prohead protease [Brucella anthropi]SUA65566.1 Mu-like prophage major head subunit gpT [Brucella anthropi]
MEQQILVPAVRRDASFRAQSFDENENTIEIVWTTGARVRRNSWWDGPYDEELEVTPQAIRLERLNAGAPFLDTHDSYDISRVLGSIVPGSAKIENGVGTARVLLSRAPGDADAVQKIRDGIIRNVSVGYRVHKVVKTEGQEGDVPLHRVVDWEPLEVSAVPIPADPDAQIRSADKANGQQTYPCIVVTRDAPAPENANGDIEMADKNNARADETTGSEVKDNSEVTTEQRGAAPVATQAGISQADVTRAAEVAAREAVERERKRSSEIRDLATRAGVADFGAEHATAGTSVEEFRELLLEKLVTEERKNSPLGAGHLIGATVIDNTREEARGEAVAAALLHRADPGAYPLTVDGARDFMGMSLLEVARECLESRGVRTRGMSKMELAASALSQRSGGLHSTSDFPVILENVLNKTLKTGYEAAPQTFRPFTRISTVPDFKDVSRVQLGEAPQFDKVNEHGEFKRGTVGEAGEKYRIETYGKVIGITRQTIINDDLGAFTRIPRAFGVQAAQLESDVVWAQILANPVMGDGKALFHADHKNLLTAGAIGKATVSNARLRMSLQTGLDGKTVLNLSPSYILVPKALQTDAETFLTTIYPAKDGDQVPASLKNLTVISEPRLDGGIARYGITGSATNYYFAADNSLVDVVELAYLEGQQGVYTETRMGFDVDGVEVKVRLDVGAKTLDWRGLQKNPFAG